MKKLYYLAIAAGLTLGLAACGGNKAEKEAADEAASASTEVTATDPAPAQGVINLTNDNQFRPDTKVTEPTVLDFNAVWCVPCKKLTPAYHIVADKYPGKVAFYSVDIDNNRETANAFHIESVPTVIIMMPDGTVERHVGLNDFIEGSNLPADATNEQITEVIAQHLDAMITNLMK